MQYANVFNSNIREAQPWPPSRSKSLLASQNDDVVSIFACRKSHMDKRVTSEQGKHNVARLLRVAAACCRATVDYHQDKVLFTPNEPVLIRRCILPQLKVDWRDCC